MIDKLEYFIALAREKHFARAAEEIGISQPTLSAAIRQLEDQLGVMLVVRGSRFQGLTPEGQRVLEWARRIVGDTRTMREEMRAARKGLSGHIRIAAIPTTLAMVPRITAPFQEKHPDVTFSIVSTTSIKILGLLENLEIDAGLTYLENEPLGRVTSVPLLHEHYCLITARGNAFSDRETVTWQEAGSIRLCLLTADMQNRRIVNQHLAEVGARIAPTVESNSTIALVAHVQTGLWASVVPMKLAEMFTTQGLVAIPIVDPEAEHLVGLNTAKRDPQTPVLQALMDEAAKLAVRLRR